MKFSKVDFDPRTIPIKTGKHRASGGLIDFLEEFLDSGIAFAKVEYTRDEYTTPQSAYVTIAQRINEHRYRIQIIMRNGDLYLIRKDN